jgi:DNA repair protein RadC
LQKLTGTACLVPMPARTSKPKTEPDETPHYHGHRERLRARFLAAGSDALPDYELLELVLFGAIPRRDVKPLAKSLLERFGSFAEVISAPAQLLAEAGLGESTITELKVIEAAAHLFLKVEAKRRPVLSSWSALPKGDPLLQISYVQSRV